jgi:hypothetical protein
MLFGVLRAFIRSGAVCAGCHLIHFARCINHFFYWWICHWTSATPFGVIAIIF